MKEAIENIKKIRELKNISREEFADQLDISLSGYSKLERGEVELTVTKMFRIAELLEVSASQILNFDASQIFNVSNNQIVNGVEVKEQINNYQDEYKDKYIKLLEAEVERLKKEVKG